MLKGKVFFTQTQSNLPPKKEFSLKSNPVYHNFFFIYKDNKRRQDLAKDSVGLKIDYFNSHLMALDTGHTTQKHTRTHSQRHVYPRKSNILLSYVLSYYVSMMKIENDIRITYPYILSSFHFLLLELEVLSIHFSSNINFNNSSLLQCYWKPVALLLCWMMILYNISEYVLP